MLAWLCLSLLENCSTTLSLWLCRPWVLPSLQGRGINEWRKQWLSPLLPPLTLHTQALATRPASRTVGCLFPAILSLPAPVPTRALGNGYFWWRTPHEILPSLREVFHLGSLPTLSTQISKAWRKIGWIGKHKASPYTCVYKKLFILQNFFIWNNKIFWRESH